MRSRRWASVATAVGVAFLVAFMADGLLAQEGRARAEGEGRRGRAGRGERAGRGDRAGRERAAVAERGARRGGAQRARARQFDPERMRERMYNRIKQQLGSTDEEWQTLQPLIEKVTQAQQKVQYFERLSSGGLGVFAGRMRFMEPAEAKELRALLENPDAAEEDLNAKLKAFREAREKAPMRLAQARQSLMEVVTVKEEATFVLMGILE